LAVSTALCCDRARIRGPGPKEILLRVRASSLNYRDLMVLKGGGRGPTKLGVIPLSDGAGEVASVGAGVTRVKIGDRVAGRFHPRWFGGPITADYLSDRLGANLDRMLAEYAALSEERWCRCRVTSPPILALVMPNFWRKSSHRQ
jgi:NADPH:quinone reductase-like Zn-dependent oxidoreductase